MNKYRAPVVELELDPKQADSIEVTPAELNLDPRSAADPAQLAAARARFLRSKYSLRLCFDYNALAELQALGYDLGAITIGDLARRGSLKMLRDVLWAAALWQNESLTRVEVGRMIPDYGMERVIAAIKEAFALSAPEKDKDSEEATAADAPLSQTAVVQ